MRPLYAQRQSDQNEGGGEGGEDRPAVTRDGCQRVHGDRTRQRHRNRGCDDPEFDDFLIASGQDRGHRKIRTRLCGASRRGRDPISAVLSFWSLRLFPGRGLLGFTAALMEGRRGQHPRHCPGGRARRRRWPRGGVPVHRSCAAHRHTLLCRPDVLAPDMTAAAGPGSGRLEWCWAEQPSGRATGRHTAR